MRIFRIFLFLLLLIHFTIIAFHHLPNNPIKHQYKFEIENYVNPFFSQEWKLFSPNPANSNMSLYYKFTFYKDSLVVKNSNWLDVSGPIIRHRGDKFWSPGQRVLKHFSSCYINVIDTNSKARELIAKNDTLRLDSIKASRFIRTAIENSYGHKGILDFSKFVYNNFEKKSLVNNYDSVLVGYKIVDARFPRFSKRNDDYFDLSKYEFRELLSRNYKLL